MEHIKIKKDLNIFLNSTRRIFSFSSFENITCKINSSIKSAAYCLDATDDILVGSNFIKNNFQAKNLPIKLFGHFILYRGNVIVMLT